jgi:hypothetical protein
LSARSVMIGRETPVILLEISSLRLWLDYKGIV